MAALLAEPDDEAQARALLAACHEGDLLRVQSIVRGFLWSVDMRSASK